MSQAPNQPTEEAKLATATEGLDLGEREWIGPMKGHPKPDPGEGGRMFALVYTGFIKPGGNKQWLKRRFGTCDPKEAERKLNEEVIPIFLKNFERAAEKMVRRAVAAETAAGSNQARPRCVAERLNRLVELYKANPDRNGTTPNVKSMVKFFIKDSGNLAWGDDRDYTREDCFRIRNQLMDRWNPFSGTPPPEHADFAVRSRGSRISR